MKQKRVLIACERSGKGREAFRKLGHDAWSCDLVPADDGSKYHIVGNVLDVLHRRWDLMIAHPPCTYLCNSGVRWLIKRKYKTTSSAADKVDLVRWNKMLDAKIFFLALWTCGIPQIAMENPIPHRYGIGCIKYAQIIQPWMFGHPESKATCLWLKNLPKLVETDNVRRAWKTLPKSKAQRLHWLPPGPERARIRSETYQGIADAMAEQWGNL